MPGTPSTRWGITKPADGDLISGWPGTMRTAIDTIDSLMMGYTATMPRPAAGVAGRFHRDSGTGVISFDTGAAWVQVSAAGTADPLTAIGTYAARPGANTVPAGFVYKATNAGTYVSDGTNWSMLAPGFFSLAIAGTETRTNVAYGLMPTPDRIQGLAMPPNGKFKIGYQAMWQESSTNAARAAIFLGANQLQVGRIGGNAGPATQAGQHGSGAIDLPLSSFSGGLISGQGIGQGADVTTGQVVGFAEAGSGLPGAQQEIGGSSYSLPTSAGQFFYPGTGGSCDIFAAAGLYDVSVQFKASGTAVVTRKNSKLWVEVWGT